MIPIAKPLLGEEEASAAREAVLSGWVTQGPRVKAFEEEFARYIGAKYACAVSNCTTALHLSLLSVGVKPGDVVLTVSHSFIATANAIRHCGAEPIFIDIDPETYNMDTGELDRILDKKFKKRDDGFYYKNVDQIAVGESPLRKFHHPTNIKLGRAAAILPVHQMGIPCNIEQILTIAKAFKLPVVEDAACAIGSEISFNGGKTWDKIGKPHGDIACFSFHPRKILTTGDGGMITTNDCELDRKFRLLRQHGMSVSDIVRHGKKEVVFEEYVVTGFNYRMTDIQAAIGIEQLKKIDTMIQERRKLTVRYEELLHDLKYLKTVKVDDQTRPNWQSYPVRILKGRPCNQLELMQFLLDKGIATRRGIMNAHQEPPYKAIDWFLPNSELCRDNTLLLPLFSNIGIENLHYISDSIHEIMNQE